MTNSTGQRQRSDWARAALIVAVVVAVAAMIGVVLWQAGEMGRRGIPLRDVLSQSSEIRPRDETEALCVDVECIEGWRTEAGVFLRFRTDDAAEYWHYVIGGDSIRADNVLLDLKGFELGRDERRYVIDVLFSGRDWSR